ncbi:hypothetical protein CH375_04115 [Leptospira ellisii]|uniref:Uncharacterized protein n=1 Tax=Leptospira ellisii TaxID=2023197 RepID=A0A2N0BNP7_9LEPT|nr:hypothetical protein CH379_14330 [Leptospira ellisii]PKA05616.1 hypothetical protein CH375_04115 [Leptospira ellisii]
MSCSRRIPDLGSIFPFVTSENQKTEGGIFPGKTRTEAVDLRSPGSFRKEFGFLPKGIPILF